jgi:rubrerythrin
MMDLDHMLDRCRQLEERAGALYRSFAANSRGNPRLYALWTRLAAEEDEHARSLVRARGMRDAVAGWRIKLDAS